MKIYSFYLPQFHTFPENNQWWGDGFTEWTNTKKGKPLFKGHYQPHVPLNDNYYDLVLEPNTMSRQIELAKDYGIDGFCFYHYWFENGKKLMEKPIEYFLESKELDIEFCLCWANENWTRRWDGNEQEVLIKQNYEDKEGWKKHFEYLYQFFIDRRYLRDDIGRPVLIIYKPGLIPELEEMLNKWECMALESGLKGLCFVYQYPNYDSNVDKLFDYRIEFEPIETTDYSKKTPFRKIDSALINIRERVESIIKHRPYKLYNYKDIIKASMKRKIDKRTWPGVFPSWDNTPRRAEHATIYYGSTPELFEKYLKTQIQKLNRINKNGIIFINAWNEWAEGAHLEPDNKFGFQYLESVKNALSELR